MTAGYPTLLPDPTFYPSPSLAAKAPPESLAYVVTINPSRKGPDGLAVIDVDPASAAYGTTVGRLEMPNV
ncbi:MAG: selenium-binding protein SBP56-related protein, partial [Actinomycetes bacterium]